MLCSAVSQAKLPLPPLRLPPVSVAQFLSLGNRRTPPQRVVVTIMCLAFALCCGLSPVIAARVLREIQLEEPIRYSAADPIEKLSVSCVGALTQSLRMAPPFSFVGDL